MLKSVKNKVCLINVRNADMKLEIHNQWTFLNSIKILKNNNNLKLLKL